MLGAIAEGTTEIKGFLMGADCLSTIECFRTLGIQIDISDQKVIVHGKGLFGLQPPSKTLDVGNSGTTMRLLTGLLSAQSFSSTITGDTSIQKRPMKRVVTPLRKMGADIDGKQDGNLCPLSIHGTSLKGISYDSPVASAQLKSSLILAGLYAKGDTTITEPYLSRNHTEIMINYFGGNIEQDENRIICHPTKTLYGKDVSVPGDISSAAYFIIAALIRPNSKVLITNVGINPTRTGILKVLKEMGGDISLLSERNVFGEPPADLLIHSSSLKGITISGSIIPRLIDEIPILAVAACYAQGTTIIKDAEELKVKESNRIDTMVSELKKLGASIEATKDGMIIHGMNPLKGSIVKSHDDHRVAMSLAIAALGAEGETTIDNSDCVQISFPNFFSYLNQL
jgi:3-phosphoshikimate 1-carboxyvinyltransferase